MHDTICEAGVALGRCGRPRGASTRWIALAALVVCAAAGALPAGSASAPQPTAAQIVAKNVAARGGLEAWRKIETMVWVGHVESPNAPTPSMPFVLQQKRPNKTRFEITVNNQRSLRVFDGTQGWKLVPTREGRPDVQPFTAQELKFARGAQGIDGPLVDYQAKGIAVAFDGSEKVEGRKAYRLSVRLPSGESHHIWIDAQTFLDIKYDRTSYNSAGVAATVPVFYRDYKAVEGLQIPAVIETGAGPDQATDKLVIEKLALNPPLDDGLFSKPALTTWGAPTTQPRRVGSVNDSRKGASTPGPDPGDPSSSASAPR
jgi:hypothetical protein